MFVFDGFVVPSLMFMNKSGAHPCGAPYSVTQYSNNSRKSLPVVNAPAYFGQRQGQIIFYNTDNRGLYWNYDNTNNDFTYDDFTYNDFTYNDFTYNDFTYNDFTFNDYL